MHSYVWKLNPGGDNIFNSEFLRDARVRDDRTHLALTGLNAIFGVDNLLHLMASRSLSDSHFANVTSHKVGMCSIGRSLEIVILHKSLMLGRPDPYREGVATPD